MDKTLGSSQRHTISRRKIPLLESGFVSTKEGAIIFIL
jgi:hypothetical protein